MSHSPVGGPALRVFEGVLARSDEQFENPYWILEKGRDVSTDEDWFGPFPAVDMRGKRVRITVEVLPEPPTDGRTSSEANYDPMTAPVPEGDMNGPHGEPRPSSEGGQR